MRVLHLYGGNLYGGVERLLVSLAEFGGLAPGLDQEFGLCYQARLARELRSLGAPVHALEGVRTSRPWQVRAARRRLADLLSARSYDTVVCHAWWSYAIFGPAARARRVPVTLWQHDLADGRGWLQRWAGRRRPDRALAWGQFMANSLQRLFPDLHPRVWAPPVPLADPDDAGRDRVRAALGAGREEVVILQASRLEPWKGHRLLLQSLARLDPSLPWRVWIAGGAQRPHERRWLRRLQEEARRAGLDRRVHWLGQRDDVAALMGAADVFCQPNTGPEPFGIVFAEAMAAGLPVVTTRGGGPDDFLPRDSGWLCPPEPAAVAQALDVLIRNPDLRRRAGAAGRTHAGVQFAPPVRMGSLAGTLAPGVAS